MRTAACFLASFLLPGLAVAQQDAAPVPTLHVNTQLVEVSAVVTETNGEPRAGLTKDDFILKQDGKEQPIRYFSQGDDLPLTFVVMIDTSGSQATFLGDEQRACDVFFETVLGRPQDRALLVEVNGNVIARSGLTNSPRDLHLALLALRSSGEAVSQTKLYDAIQAVSEKVLAKVHGRKAIILLTDGGENGSHASRADALAEAQRANAPIYAVSFSAWNAPGGGSFNQGPNQFGNNGLANLKSWSAQTGGRVYQTGQGAPLRSIFESIAEELRTQYELGYMLPPDTKPRQFHKLEVKTKEKGLKVQARAGFFTNP